MNENLIRIQKYSSIKTCTNAKIRFHFEKEIYTFVNVFDLILSFALFTEIRCN